MGITKEQYEAAIPKCCAYQTIEAHESIMLCWGLAAAVERGEKMNCDNCTENTMKVGDDGTATKSLREMTDESSKRELAASSLQGSVGLEWACLGHDPRTWWGLGNVVDGKMKPIATVMRGDSGKWAVYLGGRWSCTEPSRKLAMEAAEQLVEANPSLNQADDPPRVGRTG